MRVGILALQGAVELHEAKFAQLGVDTFQVRRAEDLAGLNAIVIPGGESTTFLHLLHRNQLWEALKAFVAVKPSWGVCAGAIVLAKKVTSPAQPSLGAIDIEVERNGYGRQTESFSSTLESQSNWSGSRVVEGVFIRAPRLRPLSAQVETLLTYQDEPVMVEQGHLLASSFHPELSEGTDVHEYFVRKMAH